MPEPSRRLRLFLRCLAALLLGILLLAGAAMVYVQHNSVAITHALLEDFTRRTGLALHVRSIGLSWLPPAVQADDVRIRGQELDIAVRTARLRPRLTALLQGRLELEYVALQNPVLSGSLPLLARPVLEGRPIGISGTCVACVMEGTRPVLSEIQALATKTSFPSPRRTASGFDYNRMYLLLAVLEKRVGFKLAQKDVFLNIAGGLRVNDPAIDLSVIAAVLSSNVDTGIESGVCMAGEVGLSGEIRPVNRIEQRIAEAEKLGFNRMIVPRSNLQGFDYKKMKIELVPVRKVEEALRALFG